ncbi:MAG TPA: tetratricopeptide repeat protein [Ferruginibacter sp.]|nr:tetratricopeptide repeat protein [Ferruginibacter sp.]
MMKVLFTLAALCITMIVQAQEKGHAEYKKAHQAYQAEKFEEARKEYLKAATQGHVAAMYSLGYMYENGQGVDPDYSEAIHWYRKAIAGGHIDAMIGLGIMYQNNDTHLEAENCFRLAAEKNDENGMFLLGYNYYQREMFDEAFRWFTSSAKKGHADAMFHVAEMYSNGLGTTADEQKSTDWYRKAAEKGHREAIEKLNE